MNKRKFDPTNLQLNVDDKAMKLMSSVELSGITSDEKRNFNPSYHQHLQVSCKSAKCSDSPVRVYVTLYMRDCSHYEMRENKRHLCCGFP